MATRKLKLVIDNAIYMFDDIFASFGNISAVVGSSIDNKTLIDTNADILIVRSRTKVNKELLQNTNIKFIGSAVSGLEHIDTDYLVQNNIAFAHARGSNANAVAEYIIAALVNIAYDFNFNLCYKTLAIIGVGCVGKALVKKANALNIKLLLNDPIRAELENNSDFVHLNTALQADIISFHTPLTKIAKYPSYKLLNKGNFCNINDNTIIINSARGGVIDENIWQNTKTLANVIDCWECEPNINKNLQNSAYLATPHIAGHSIDAKFNGSLMIYKALCRFLQIPIDYNIKNLLNISKKTIATNNLKDSINAVYNFIDDDRVLKNNNFENYRRNYPKRYEWQNFNNKYLQKLV